MNLTNSPRPMREQIQRNYLSVLERIESAASRSARPAGEIQVIGVTKYVDSTVARWLVDCGCRKLAESRPQMLWDKADALADLQIDWHLIGHLQRNKAKRTLPLVSTVHSLDSSRLLLQIGQDAGDRVEPLKLLLEMNISGDPTKTGMMIADGEALLEDWQSRTNEFPNLKIVGLMGMGSLQGGPDKARQEFELLRNLRNRWSIRFGMPLADLSMGMSDDFEVAIEEGATMVRIGSILFAD